MDMPYLSTFCLVGGTSLSLQIGHRKSIDLDLFSEVKFDSDELLKNLEKDFPQIEVLTKMEGTLLTRIQGIKVDILRFNYSTIRPVRMDGNLRLLTPQDIAPMKLDAIAGRGKKKDFYDSRSSCYFVKLGRQIGAGTPKALKKGKRNNF